MKDWLLGLWAVTCLGFTMAWEVAQSWWKKSSESQKSIVLAVVIILVALSIAGVARAENAPKSNFGVVNSLSEPGTAFACYLSDGNVAMTPGIIHTCLVLQAVPPGVLATFGQVTFCTMTGMHKDKPAWSCGKYNDMAKLAGGI